MLATAACGDTQPPSPPTSLLASGVTQTGATLSWVAAADDVGVSGYDVFANGTKVGAATTAKCVIFTPAAGATVSMTGGLEVHASSLWFKGTRSGAVDVDKSGYNWRVRSYVDVEVDSGGSLQDHVTFNGIYAKAFTAS